MTVNEKINASLARILRQMEKACAFAVFEAPRGVRIVSSTTEFYERTLRDKANQLIGIYDHHAHAQAVLDDLIDHLGRP